MTTSVSPRAGGRLNPTRQQLDELDALLQRMLELPVHPLEKMESTKSEDLSEASSTGSPQPPLSSQQKDEAAPLPPRPSRPLLSYTVVETASPRPLPPASGFEPQPLSRKPRLVPVTPPPETPSATPEASSNGDEAWVPLRSTWQPSGSTWPPLAESWHQPPNVTPLPATSRSIAEPQSEPPTPISGKPAAIVEAPPLPADSDSESKMPNAEGQTPAEPLGNLSAQDVPLTVPWPLLPLVWFNQGFDACLVPLGAAGRWLCGRGRVVLGFLGLTCLAAAIAIAVNSGMGWSR